MTKNEKEREILETFLWIFTYSYNMTLAFLNIIPCYSQQIWRIIFYGRPQFREGMQIKVFIKNKIIYIHRLTLHFFSVFFILIYTY